MTRRDIPFTSRLSTPAAALVLLWLPVHILGLPWLLYRVFGVLMVSEDTGTVSKERFLVTAHQLFQIRFGHQFHCSSFRKRFPVWKYKLIPLRRKKEGDL